MSQQVCALLLVCFGFALVIWGWLACVFQTRLCCQVLVVLRLPQETWLCRVGDLVCSWV